MSNDRAVCIPEPWYHWHRFAVLPHLRTRPADEQNTGSFHIHWLVFRAWSIDSVDTGAEVYLNDQDLVIRGRIPYLIFGLFVPVFPRWMMQRFWRKSRMSKRHEAEARAAKRSALDNKEDL